MHGRINKLYREGLQAEALRVEETAIVLGVGRTKIFELIQRGDLAAIKIDKSLRVRRSDAMDFLKGLPRVGIDAA